MKTKKFYIIIVILFLTSIFSIVIFQKNNKKYIMQDGIMLALTLDGESITTFPSGKNYSIEIGCNNATGKWDTENWKLLINDITGNVTCNLDFYTLTEDDKLKSVVESKSIRYTGSNNEEVGYRYSGKTPNNYVWFNNELWRIIGSIPTCTSSGCSTSENLVKIIRNQSIGGIAYDVSGSTGAWGNNSLYKLLNNYYYGKKDGTNSGYCSGYSTSAKGNCDYTAKGIDANGFFAKMIKNVYWNTGLSSAEVTANQAYINETATQTISGNVGIMNASDYGYASDQTYHNTLLSKYNQRGNVNSNWIYGSGMDWTSTQSGTNTALIIRYELFLDYSDGSGYLESYSASGGDSVRPVVYLNSGVYVVSGDGSIINPYQIAM